MDKNDDSTAESAIQNTTFDNTIGMEFVLIPAGNFNMGSPSDEEGRLINEGPVHQVQIIKTSSAGVEAGIMTPIYVDQLLAIKTTPEIEIS